MRREYHIGPGAASLMLIAVVLAMSILALLSVMSARNDRNLSLRAAQVTQEIYALNARAERSLAELDAALKGGTALPEGMTRDGDAVYWDETTDSGRTLHCGVSVSSEGAPEWIEHRLETEIAEDDRQWSY